MDTFLSFLKNFIEVQLTYNVVLISAVQQSDSVIHVYILFHILFHYGLSQDFSFFSVEDIYFLTSLLEYNCFTMVC